jgi:hypothetical protein
MYIHVQSFKKIELAQYRSKITLGIVRDKGVHRKVIEALSDPR